MSHFLEKKYVEQYLRTKRWYKRFKDINDNCSVDVTSGNHQDEMCAFFINCYHLKDWIKNDEECKIDKSKVEKFVNDSQHLQVCRDFCHGLKHLKLNNPKLNKVSIDHREFTQYNKGGPWTKLRYKISIGGNKIIDAFELATECMKEWDSFLCKNITEFYDNKKIGNLK